MEATVSLTFPPRPEHVSLARMVAGALAERHGITGDVVEEIRLLVSEACTNAVRAQMAERVDEPIVLECRANGAFKIEITDHASGISDEMIDCDFPDFEHIGYGSHAGFGIPLMCALADRTDFIVHASGGTTVALTVGHDHLGR